MTKISLKAGERIDDLQFRGLKIIQNPDAFCFGMDAILLAHFARVNEGDWVIDLGTGCGVMPILLSGHSKGEKFIGLELQETMVDMANRSVLLNDLQERVQILSFDARIDGLLQAGGREADLLLANPPYYPVEAALIGDNIEKAMARMELTATLEDFVSATSRLVRNGGRVAFVHRAERLLDLMSLMRQYHIEPKRLQIVQARPQKAPHLILIEGRKLGKAGLKLLPTLLLYGEDGKATEDLKRIYEEA